MRSLSRRLSIRNDVNHRGVSSVTVENPQKDLHEITPPSKESDSEQNAQREDAEFLSLLKDSRVTPEPSQLTITPAATAIDHENGGRSRPKSIAIHAAARTSTISLTLYQPHEDDWVRQIEPTDGTGVDEKCLAIELEDDKIPVIPEEQPISTPAPEATTNAAADAPAGLLTSSNLRALDTITADSSPMARTAAKNKDLPDLPLPAYPPTSDGGSSTLSATHRQHQHRLIKRKASTIKKSHHGSIAASGHHLRHNSAHHARSRSSTTLFMSLVSRRNTVTDTKPPATATASNSNNKIDEGHPPATDRAPTLLSRVPSMLLSRTSTLRTAIRPSSRSRRSALNPYSTKAKPIKPVPLATINRRCQAYSSNDPVQAYLLAQERVGAWVATQEGLVEWFRKEGRWEEYMRTKREEKERRKMREMEEEQERMACAKWRLRRWLSEDHGSPEGSIVKARQGSVDVDADLVDGMVEWPEEGIWDGFVSGKKIEAEE
ncbi:uncharacterized protein LTHEOB_3021 [Lasiodiplodia theobromae]|uniref:uncharacterized protein n=1 Tax=Lasiodiplodia theobromae TaxID=45133 RepID=UPI0015C38B1D|nr:uncharacterized protein LTHEOB_3021 [Lasiodiplodia theobromae]KAF4535046.1 hypothetical protein LTHEOB_3021 [Lasiodiplodia theobromae]